MITSCSYDISSAALISWFACSRVMLVSKTILAYRFARYGSFRSSASRWATNKVFSSISSAGDRPSILSEKKSSWRIVLPASSFSLILLQSFSAPGTPHDNSVMETFFASLKREELYPHKYRSEREFRAAVERYIEFYNAQRPHKTLRYKTPNQKEMEYVTAAAII